MSKLTEDEYQEELDKIVGVFKRGGPFSHNLVRMDLSRIARTDEESASKIYEELQGMGY